MADLLVTTTNPEGHTVTIRVAQDERGLSLVESLRRRVRRDELTSIEVVEADDDADAARRGNPATPEFRRSGKGKGKRTTAADADDVPRRGTIEDVLVWVNGGPLEANPVDGWVERAERALAAEQAKGDKARVKLVDKLAGALEDHADDVEHGLDGQGGGDADGQGDGDE